ncbi:flavin reductase family protein [Chloroflexota bacterium]
MKKSIMPDGIKPFSHCPVWVIDTYDNTGKANVMTTGWGGICCSRPPAIMISLRKATYTYGNLMARKAFTVNVPSEKHAREVDYFGIASGRSADKFTVSGFTPVRSELVDAPYVAEFPLVLECRLIHSYEVGSHTMFVGEIVDIKAEDTVLGEKDLPDMENIKPIVYSPWIRNYYGMGKFIGRAHSIGKELLPGDPRG